MPAAAAAAGMAHVVTVSHFTAEDEFPAAAVIVDVVGDARTPATVRSGLDVRDERGVIGVDGLEKILAARS